jgi:cell fate regulator YaaT (PSP1 superfamily)
MCCLAYEYDTYVNSKKNFPKIGKRVKVPQGEGKVVKHNTLNSTITVLVDDGKEVTLPLRDITLLSEQDNKTPNNNNQPPKEKR